MSPVFSDRILRDLLACKRADGSLGSRGVQVALAEAILELGLYLDTLPSVPTQPPAFSEEFSEIKVGGTD